MGYNDRQPWEGIAHKVDKDDIVNDGSLMNELVYITPYGAAAVLLLFGGFLLAGGKIRDVFKAQVGGWIMISLGMLITGVAPLMNILRREPITMSELVMFVAALAYFVVLMWIKVLPSSAPQTRHVRQHQHQS